MYQLIKTRQEIQVQRLQHHKQIILLVLVEQLHMLQVKIQQQHLIPLLLGLLVEPQRLIQQQHIQHHGILVQIRQKIPHAQHQLVATQQLLGVLVELQHLILQLLSQPHGQQVKVLLDQRQGQHQLVAAQQLLGTLVEPLLLTPRQLLQ